jgi:hypothetical protein
MEDDFKNPIFLRAWKALIAMHEAYRTGSTSSDKYLAVFKRNKAKLSESAQHTLQVTHKYLLASK